VFYFAKLTTKLETDIEKILKTIVCIYYDRVQIFL